MLSNLFLLRKQFFVFSMLANANLFQDIFQINKLIIVKIKRLFFELILHIFWFSKL
jgi:hypothetical protein